MEKVKRILCIGNSSVDTDLQCKKWAEKFGIKYKGLFQKTNNYEGCFHVNLSDEFTLDDLHFYHTQFQLLIYLDQTESSYDHLETYRNIDINLSYLSKTSPILRKKNDLHEWTNLENYVNFTNKNLVIHLGMFKNVEECRNTVAQIKENAEKQNCNWLIYRANKHESNHYEITKELLTVNNFVLLTPGDFDKNHKKNITVKIYNHWYNFFLKKLNNYI